MAYRHFIRTALIAGIHSLRRIQIVGNLLLCLIVIFPKVAQSLCIIQLFSP